MCKITDNYSIKSKLKRILFFMKLAIYEDYLEAEDINSKKH
jgi:hypothetical protein